jgi:hypothetical protein
MRVRLRDLVQVRCGDKGNDSDVNVFAPDPETYEVLKGELTAERVKRHYGELVEGDVVRYEVPNVLALKFHLKEALGGGAASSLRLDNLGKTMASAMLRMELEVDETQAGGRITSDVGASGRG